MIAILCVIIAGKGVIHMAQATISIRTDAVLKRDFEQLCQDIGMNMTTALNVIMKQSVREKRIPVTLSAGPVSKHIVTEEDLRRGAEEIASGLGFEVTPEELDALAHEPEDGPTFQALKRRHAELEVKLREWRAEKGCVNE